MPRKTIEVLTDDYDGKTLPEGTQPVHLSLGRTTYALYLSEENHGKLLEALTPFIDGAETTTRGGSTAKKATSGTRTSTTVDTYGYPIADVRSWAQKTKFTQENGKTIGEKGRIPQAVYDAYNEAKKAGKA